MIRGNTILLFQSGRCLVTYIFYSIYCVIAAFTPSCVVNAFSRNSTHKYGVYVYHVNIHVAFFCSLLILNETFVVLSGYAFGDVMVCV